MAKKLTANHKRIARMAPPFNKITGADFKMLRKGKKKKKQLCLVKTHHQEKNLKNITPK